MDTSSLMEQILSKENLNAAYLQVVRNKGAAGVDGMTVEELGAYLSENGESIREQLRTRKYKPQPVRRVEIPKPDGGVRNLGVPTVVDRFVQQAVAQVLTPIFAEQFHDHSYGFRPNRCAQQAVLKALEMMNDGHDWIVDIDLAKFFDTVDHDKLMTIFGRTIKDGDRLRMCIWKHWKTPLNRAKNLIKLGISRKFAWSTAYYGAHIAHVCQGGAMNMAVTKERLTRFGLVSMADYYAEKRVTC